MSYHATLPTEQDSQPVFVNRHNVSVDVFDEKRIRLTVFPLQQQARHPRATYYVKGEHYRQFADVGSLALFQNGRMETPPDPAEIRRAAAAQTMEAERKRVAASIEESKKSQAAQQAQAVPQLDTETAFLIQRASPNANAQQRADLAAYVLKRKAGDMGYQLSSELASYTIAMDAIIKGETVAHDTHIESPMDDSGEGKQKVSRKTMKV